MPDPDSAEYEPDEKALQWFASWVMDVSTDDCWLDASWAHRRLLAMANEKKPA